MTRERSLILLQCAVGLGALVLAPVPPLVSGLAAWQLATVFALAVAILTAFSPWLPRGDSVDSTAPVAFAAAVFITPPFASLLLAMAWAVGMTARRRAFDVWRALEQISRRALLMCAAYVALDQVRGYVVLHNAHAFFGKSHTLEQVLIGTGYNNALTYVAIALCGILFVGADLLIEQAHSAARFSMPYLPLVVSNVRLRGAMILAEMSVGILTALIVPSMGVGGVAIAGGMLLVMRQSFALLLEMQASYTATVEAFARSLEAYDIRQEGHHQRVANMATDAARRMGFQSKDLEDITYAAWFHDVSELGTDDEGEESERKSSDVLADVKLLGGALPILRILDAGGDVEGSLTERDLLGAYLVSRLSDFDSAATLGSELDPERGDAIGARLYADKRRTVDRVLRQVEEASVSSGESLRPAEVSAE